MGRFKLETSAPAYERPLPPRSNASGSGLLFFIFSIGMIAGAFLVLLVNDQSGTVDRVLDLVRS
jgi:hypothetical protein